MFLAEPKVHRIDLGLLVDDDLFCEPAHHGVFSEAQLRLGHIDGALMMEHHHRGKIVIELSGFIALLLLYVP